MTSALTQFRRRIETEILPFWATHGFDAESGLFRERLDTAGADLVQAPRRAMVQARQIWVYAQAAIDGVFPAGADLARRALSSLIDRYCEDGDVRRGFTFSVDQTGAVVSARRDSYTHAFILLALASVYKLAREAAVLTTAEATAEFIDRRLWDPDHGGFFDDEVGRFGRKRQNPLMHMLEAYLALHEAWPEGPFLDKAHGLIAHFRERLFREPQGVLAEVFEADWSSLAAPADRVFEPGHHFEWIWLLRWHGRLTGADHRELADRLWATACGAGLAPSGLCYDSVAFDLTPAGRASRLWPHTEGAKAAASGVECGSPGAAAACEAMLGALVGTFLAGPFAGGWIDHIDEAGRPLVDYVPASSLYHLYGAYAETTRVFGAP